MAQMLTCMDDLSSIPSDGPSPGDDDDGMPYVQAPPKHVIVIGRDWCEAQLGRSQGCGLGVIKAA